MSRYYKKVMVRRALWERFLSHGKGKRDFGFSPTAFQKEIKGHKMGLKLRKNIFFPSSNEKGGGISLIVISLQQYTM